MSVSDKANVQAVCSICLSALAAAVRSFATCSRSGANAPLRTAHCGHRFVLRHATTRPAIPDFRCRCKIEPNAHWLSAGKPDYCSHGFRAYWKRALNDLLFVCCLANDQELSGGLPSISVAPMLARMAVTRSSGASSGSAERSDASPSLAASILAL